MTKIIIKIMYPTYDSYREETSTVEITTEEIQTITKVINQLRLVNAEVVVIDENGNVIAQSQ